MRRGYSQGVILFVAFLGAVKAKAVAEETISLEEDEAVRDPKLFSVFQIVQFNNDACNASSGIMGTCYTTAECNTRNGTADGTCASGFGVCCTSVLGSDADRCADGSVTFANNNTYLVNPGYPSGVSTSGCTKKRQAVTTYTYKIRKFSATTSQIRLDFLEYETDAPSMGDCSNGTLTITGVDMETSSFLPTNLCGVLTDQHMYLSVADASVTDDITIKIALTSVGTQKWRILVRHIESTQTTLLAPRGCLQYYRESTASFATFNHNSGNGELLNDHNYAVCIGEVDDFCDVSLSSSMFDLDASSSLTVGGTQYTGQTFGTSGSAIWKFMGPYVATVMTTSSNTGMNAGFNVGYLLLPC